MLLTVLYSLVIVLELTLHAKKGKTATSTYQAPGQPEAPYIEWANLRYKLIKTSGIGNAYGVTYARAGKPRYFSAFFEKIPSGATEINIKDGGDGAWAFYGIKLSFEIWK
ncbi:hypothetical protein ACFQT0_17835 [Hymenobacter humi]|uniref:Uncharacterized protein n=1 Tax=Hymenobacter humi TaxID=1411620 RepID=A0ABW2U7Z5_9BACT